MFNKSSTCRSIRNGSIGCNGIYNNNNNNKTVKFSQDIEMDEMSEKFLTKLGVNHIDEVISSVHEREGRHFMDHITSCNKVRDNTTIFVFKNIDKYCTNKLHTCL